MTARTRRSILPALTAFALLAAAGCGSGHVPLTGEVSYDGQPIDEGTITFVSPTEDDAAGKPSARIEGGKYKFDKDTGPAPGKYKVQITWLKKSGQKVSTGDGEVRDDKVNVLPAKFNTQTTLKAEVKSGSPKMDFPLKSTD